MKRNLFISAIAALSMACGAPAEETAEVVEEQVEEVVEEAMTEDAEMAAEDDSTHFGKLITEEGAISVDEFASQMEGKDSMEVKITAVAQEVCQKKGCWMKVEMADEGSMRIRFKDYGFFVPKDLSGREVVFSGMAYRETVSVEDLQHYAEDGGSSAEEIAAITEPETNISFMADGVMIR